MDNRNIRRAALLLVMVLWGLHLGYPLHHLQDVRWGLFGHLVPVYYFFTVALMISAAILALSTKRDWTRWELLWWLLPLICLPGIIFSDDRLWSLRQWLSWIIRGIIPGGILLLVAPRKQISSLLQFWIYPIIAAASLLGLVEIFYHYNPLAEIPYTLPVETFQPDNPLYRPITHLPWSEAPQGTQGSRIPYAATLVGFFPLGLWFFKYQKTMRSAHLLALGLLLLTLLLARVRSVWLATLAVLLLMQGVGLFKNRKQTIKGLVIAALCLLLFLAWPQTRQLLWDRLNSFRITEGSIQARLAVFETVGILKDRLLQGVGFGQFPTACRPYYHGTIMWYGTPDNQYLRWLLENGALGFLCLATFFIGLVRAGWKKIKLMQDVQEADFYKSLLVGWLGIATTFLFFDGFYWGACNMTFWCFLGLFSRCLSPRTNP